MLPSGASQPLSQGIKKEAYAPESLYLCGFWRLVQILHEHYRNGSYLRAGGVVDPLPEDAPFFVKDYYDYYKTERGSANTHKRVLKRNDVVAV